MSGTSKADEIEITYEMVRAGISVLPFTIGEGLPNSTEETLVSEVYRAMEEERRKAQKIPIKIAREMAAAGRDVIEWVWPVSSPDLSSLFDEHTAVLVYEAMHATRLRLMRHSAVHNHGAKSGARRNRHNR